MTPSREMPRAAERLRLLIQILGAVQGVGFRPFVYRLAREMGLAGWVCNSSSGVSIEVEGPMDRLERFLLRIEREKPPRAYIQSLESSFLDPVGHTGFEVRESGVGGRKTALVLPDIATCADCLREILDPRDRRYHYPFTNCTNCGPRFSIIEGLPYDRPRTTMRRFTMCDECRREYTDPADRRFHAQPNACPACGPHLALWSAEGRVDAARHDALLAAADLIRKGKIVAAKGLGGFHLLVDARNDGAVRLLRARKRREEKPLALMFPSLGAARIGCEVSDLEERLLCSPESPIVLLRARVAACSGNPGIAPSVAPGNPWLGAMLPYTPLHHLLLSELGFPVVATSGNLSDEPICTDENEALRRLSGIADAFLVHDRPIARHVDDSITRIMAGRELVLRRARGYAPLPQHVGRALPVILGVGAHLKNTIALSVGEEVFVSQHIGDLETAEAAGAFHAVIESFKALYESSPSAVACDLHPDYISTHDAKRMGLPVHGVQHHHAHVVACMAENRLEGTVLGVSWDGTGYGTDGTVWGGEFLVSTRSSFRRVAHLRTFRLPGGDRAVREPRRSALGLLHEAFGDDALGRIDLPTIAAFSRKEIQVIHRMLEAGVNAPITSSVGRLFDAVASIIGLRQVVRFEGQAPMELEFALGGAGASTDPGGTSPRRRYPMDVLRRGGTAPALIDWKPLVIGIIDDLGRGSSPREISLEFHESLVDSIVQVARITGEERVVLTGGCFQNKYLTERAVEELERVGFRPYWHQRIPPNDGGISLGQVIASADPLQEGSLLQEEG